MFLGDNVLENRIALNIPEHGNIKGQMAAIEMALKPKVVHLIPGHGLSGGREIVEIQLTFLKTLCATVKREKIYYDHDMSDFELKEMVMNDLVAHKDWTGFYGLGRVINEVFIG